LALPLYAATLFVSAFILFLVQPMIGKLILPKLGGTPQVWNTCMVFFQMVLLAGYAYTHAVSNRLRLRQQLIIHAVLLLVPLAVLIVPWQTIFPGSILPNSAFDISQWRPDLGVNPIFSALLILFIIVGLPFFVVSTSAPLLQRWFVHTGHPAAKDPYFLYGASNLGSMLALLAYPALIEPFAKLNTQTWIWTAGYLVLIVFVISSIALVWGASRRDQGVPDSSLPDLPPSLAPEKPSEITAETAITAKAPATTAVKPGAPRPTPAISLPDTDQLTMGRRLRWIALAAIPSSMMLGITTHITTDLSPVPLIWLIPLTLYLLSFILVFARWPVVWTEEPHRIMLYVQPIAIALMLISDFMQIAHSYLKAAIFFDVFGFFFTTMVCHGELAKDRPSTRHLTEFYLMMSIGGMLGGMFNGLLAPNIPFLFEYYAAIMAAALIRPKLAESGWVDKLIAGAIDPSAGEGGPRKGKGPRPAARGAVTPNMALTLDLVLGVATGVLSFILLMMLFNPRVRDNTNAYVAAYGIPLGISCLFLFRPIRFAVAIILIILVNVWHNSRTGAPDFRTRGYFGLIKVSTEERGEEGRSYRQMIHGHINHGMNFLKPRESKDWGNPSEDFSRLATTYYHRFGPGGIVMEQFNWFPGPQNTFWADARIGASLLAGATVPFGSPLPADQLAALWSEPPYATIGLGTGTMASYARPYQHMHFYEIDNLVRRLSLRKEWPVNINYLFFRDKDDPTQPDTSSSKLALGGSSASSLQFTYLRDALARGAHLQVLMGDARLRMNMPYKNHYEHPEDGGGPRNFYHMMVVDAFSSDAIPAHLITKEATEMYFNHLTEKGILCYHTSNRFVDLPLVVGDVAAALGLAAKRGHDPAPQREHGPMAKEHIGHFTSEWVMVARKAEYLRELREPADFREAFRAVHKGQRVPLYWENTETHGGRFLWTDDFYNILSVMR
jgi:hypothetical protein